MLSASKALFYWIELEPNFKSK